MKRPSLLFILLLNAAGVFCQPAYFQQQVNYKIDVTLNDIENTLDGFEIIQYTNNSPDTLQFIWFHLWPNAYKNDQTAFSEQLLQLGRTDFYFSNNDKRGYINRLDFKVNGITSALEDHPQYIDVAKLMLPSPLPPGDSIKITTPFHEKIPYNFSRGGHVAQSYQITQWYPKPAVYDNRGWHPMPYLDQGEFYSEFGNFNVDITLPENYAVAATGELQNTSEINWLIDKRKAENVIVKKEPVVEKPVLRQKKPMPVKGKKIIHESPSLPKAILARVEMKTLNYIQNNVHDFAWFADKNFIVNHDTLQLASGRIIDAYSFYTPEEKDIWLNSIEYLKDAIKTRSKWLGEYPYNVVTAVEAKMGFEGGMEYPTITSISPLGSAEALDNTIEHEVGHNWTYGILATNERDHPWMDEGMNTYFDNRYKALKYPEGDAFIPKEKFIQSRAPHNVNGLVYRTIAALKKDQPIETASEDFSEINYNEIAYYKTGKWMKELENYVGQPLFDSCLHAYYHKWKFKHPYPEDFKKVIKEVSGKNSKESKNVDSIFSLLTQKGLMEKPAKKDFKVIPFISFKETDKHNDIFVAPSFGLNYYDKFMIGALVHNYTLPEPSFHFLFAPMYATGSKKFTGIARAGYNIMSYGLIRKAEISLNGETFTVDDFTDSTGKKNYQGFSKLVPSVKLVFKNKNPLSKLTKSIQWKTYFIRETGLSFTRDTVNQVDVISYPKTSRYLNQLKFTIENNRALYPYFASLQAEQGKSFVRLAFDGNYFFNYAKDGGMNVRLFGGKFIYLGDKTIFKQFETDRYHLNMSGPKG
ncbi:MAG: M1 family metallopeptidase, partial [Ginsengibacter sp.]